MRRDKWITGLIGAMLTWLLSFSGAMCLLTAFDLYADPTWLALGCGSCAVVFCVCFSLKLGLVPWVVIAFFVGYLWQEGSLEALLYQVSYTYDMAYDCGVLYWSAQAPAGADVTGALCAVGCVVALVTAWTVCRRGTAFGATVTALLPLGACLVITDRVPDTAYIFLLLAGLTVLLLSQSTRRKNAAQGNLLTAMVTVPVILALLLLFWAVPRETYHGQARADRMLFWAENWFRGVTGQGSTGSVVQSVELSDTGQLLKLHTPVMTVKAEQGDTLYLREQGFQMYSGESWYNETGVDLSEWTNWELFTSAGQVEITTRELHMLQFVPYYVRDAQALDGFGITGNVDEKYTYSFERLVPATVLPESTPDLDGVIQGGFTLEFPIGVPTPDALSLPDHTVAWAEPLAMSVTEGKRTVWEKAQAIADYVRGSADYSRNTGRMPSDEKDFARWFLEESDTGYCVHFATATAVLLRSVGIPAQYVTGYVAKVGDGTPTTVYQDQAHAWVEYYIPGMGWAVLESTPAEGVPTFRPQGASSTTPQTTQPSIPDQSAPETTAPSAHRQEDPRQTLPGLWQALLWSIAVLLAVIGQWQLRLQLREKKLHTGDANTRAIACWQEVVRLSRLLGTRPEPALFAIAQKAKFSQHTLEEAELAPLDTCIRQYKRKLKQKPWYMQPVYKLILAIY